MDDTTTLALLGLAGVGGVAYMMSARDDPPAKKAAKKDLVKILVGEGVAEDVAERVVERVPATTDYQKEFFGAILKNAAADYLNVNKQSYTEYDNWQNLQVMDVPTEDNLFQMSIRELQDMLTYGPFEGFSMSVQPVGLDNVVFFSPSALFASFSPGGCLMTKKHLILFLQTVDVVLTNNAFEKKKPVELLAGLEDFITAFFSNKVVLTYENAKQIASTEHIVATSSDPQEWALNSGYDTFLTPEISQMVNAARNKYSARANITTHEVDKMINLYLDITLSAKAEWAVPDAHAFLNADMRAQIKKELFGSGAIKVGTTIPVPKSMEDLRESFISRGFTFDQIELLNEQLAEINSKEEAIAALSDPTVMRKLGPIHEEIVALIADAAPIIELEAANM